jgi:hypothetical protein
MADLFRVEETDGGYGPGKRNCCSLFPMVQSPEGLPFGGVWGWPQGERGQVIVPLDLGNRVGAIPPHIKNPQRSSRLAWKMPGRWRGYCRGGVLAITVTAPTRMEHNAILCETNSPRKGPRGEGVRGKKELVCRQATAQYPLCYRGERILHDSRTARVEAGGDRRQRVSPLATDIGQGGQPGRRLRAIKPTLTSATGVPGEGIHIHVRSKPWIPCRAGSPGAVVRVTMCWPHDRDFSGGQAGRINRDGVAG